MMPWEVMVGESVFDGLNNSQKEAAATLNGPVLVVAGPGTGKTLTIVRRIAALIGGGVRSENIAAVTFTNRAAREMRERLFALLGKRSEGIFVGTFHRLGLTIAKENMPGGLTIANRDEQMDILRSVALGYGGKIEELAEVISRKKGMMEGPEGELKDVCQAYQSALREKGMVDFDDLIAVPIKLLEDRTLLARYRDRFRHIIVDEFQDINPAQYRLLKLLSGDKRNVCAVGDPDQAIYAFRGADVERFLDFEKDFTKTETIVLAENYRSSRTILEGSSAMIKQNEKRVDKKVNPTREGGDRIRIVSVPDERTEGEFIVGEIEARIGGTSHFQLMKSKCEKKQSGGSYGFSDFAVIFRTNAQARALEETFLSSGIPYQVIGKHSKRRREGAENVLSQLRRFGAMMDKLTPLGSVPAKEFIEWALTKSGLKDEMSGETSRGVYSLLDVVGSGGTAADFLNEACLLTPADDFDPRADAVALMTIHMTKGLEFEVVFVTGAEDGLIPYRRPGDSGDAEEERRLLYVAMTRAKEELFLIHARKRSIFGKRGHRFPSPFLKEIGEEFTETHVVPERGTRRVNNKQMTLF
ncbi:MAG: ATP-dependent DNA helicase PcrA [Syntrophorhabdus sp. PtaU1.Bin153]|nr:MAG: ATP-dependent DNA helicase PcrA [Syntrophorhabdus sp. PtaU1.Bin153]